jgi:hypothetical protein
MLTEKDHINIELYLSKQLQGEEKRSFEAELHSRPELMEEARFQRKLSQGLQIIGERKERTELKEYLNNIKTENTPSKGKTISFGEPKAIKKETRVIPMWQQNAFRIALAASFVGFLAVGSYYLFIKADSTNNTAILQTQSDSTKSNENPIKQVGEPIQDELLAFNENQKLSDAYYNDLPKFRSDAPSDLVNGIEFYYSKKPKEALKAFPKSLPVIKSEYSEAQKDSVQNRIDNITFYRGLSYLINKEDKNAIKDLQIASKSSDITIQEFATWYLALAYLHNNQINNAETTLKEIQNNEDSRFAPKASEILKKIK